MQPVTMAALIGASIIFVGGLLASLLSLRLIGKKADVDPTYDQRFARVKPLLRVAGPALMIGAILVLVIEPPWTPPPLEWRVVTTSDGVCQVDMPGTPTSEEGPLRVQGLGEPQAQQLKVVLEKGRVLYLLSHSDIHETPQDMSPSQLLDAIRQNTLEIARHLGTAHLVSEKDILDEQDYRGKELTLDIDRDRMRSKWVLVDKRLYRAIVIVPRDEAHLRDAERCLASFRIRKKPDAGGGP
jgi:hypothetical protein